MSFLVLRDCSVKSLVVDGVDIGDPKAQPLHGRNQFRGFHGVPRGPHTIAAHVTGAAAPATVSFTADGAGSIHVYVLLGGVMGAGPEWDDADAETVEFFTAIIENGSMVATGALRPWPAAGGAVAAIGGGEAEEEKAAALDRIFQGGVAAADAVLARPLPPKEGHVYDDADLARLAAAFHRVVVSGDADAYLQCLHFHYIMDMDMAKQPAHFAKYAAALAEHVRELPGLLDAAPVRQRVEALAEDLRDTGVDELVAAAEPLEAAL